MNRSDISFATSVTVASASHQARSLLATSMASVVSSGSDGRWHHDVALGHDAEHLASLHDGDDTDVPADRASTASSIVALGAILTMMSAISADTGV